jgi:hypothetical protein
MMAGFQFDAASHIPDAPPAQATEVEAKVGVRARVADGWSALAIIGLPIAAADAARTIQSSAWRTTPIRPCRESGV